MTAWLIWVARIFRGAVLSPQAVHRQVAAGLLSIFLVHVKNTLREIIVQPRDQGPTKSTTYILYPGTISCNGLGFSGNRALGKTFGPRTAENGNNNADDYLIFSNDTTRTAKCQSVSISGTHDYTIC